MRRKRVMAIQDIHEKLISGGGPATAGEFFVTAVDRITERIGDVAASIEERVAEVEDTIITVETEPLCPQLTELRRESIAMRRYST